jgi:microcin C transport system ATP-binding protein
MPQNHVGGRQAQIAARIFVNKAWSGEFVRSDHGTIVMDAINQPLLSVRDLSVAFRQQGKLLVAVDRVSFEIKRGECVALVGESGSGKSVSALSILKLLPYPTASHPSGSIRFKGQELLSLSEHQIRGIRGNDISIIFQEPMTSLNPLHTIEAQIVEIMQLHNPVSTQMARARTLELLGQVGIPEPETRLKSYPHQLSGGQRQRVMIAMALANEPDLLIADEPTTALDVTVQAQILTLLAEIRSRLGMSLLFITHDLGIVRRIADRVCVMKGGEIVEQGPVEQVFTAPKHPYTRDLLAAEPKPDPAPPRPEQPIVMSTDDLKVWFPIKRGLLRSTVGHIKAVDGVSLAVRKGETLGVVGESGSGKTTLGLALLRLISSEGPIVFLGKDIQGLKFQAMRPFRRDMQIVFQDPFGSLSPRMSVGDIIAEGLSVHQKHLSREEREARVVKAMEDVGLEPEWRFRYPHEFSGGQRQRISIARAAVLEPNFVVLDEPTSALDMLLQAQMVDLLRELQRKRDLTYMFISHDLRVVASLASHLIVMRHGKVVEEGPAAQLFKAPQSDYTRALFAAAFRHEATGGDSVAT